MHETYYALKQKFYRNSHYLKTRLPPLPTNATHPLFFILANFARDMGYFPTAK